MCGTARGATPPATTPRPTQRVARADLRRVLLAPAICPLPTTVALIATALAGGTRCAVARALRAHLRARDVAALLPLRATERSDGSGGRPNEVVPIMAGATMDEQLDAVRAVDPEALAGAVAAATAAGHPTRVWRIALGRDPAAWLRAYVAAVARAWEVVEPVWARTSHLLDREAQRIGVAAARGAGAELVEELLPFATSDGEDLLLPSHSTRSGRVRVDRTLQLVPLAAPVHCAGWTDDYADRVVAVRYSAIGGWPASGGAPPEALDALLGPRRAAILRWLERPVTAGTLAARLHGTPSMVTHHLDALERAGLITRTREGRHIRVARTARGDELLALYTGT